MSLTPRMAISVLLDADSGTTAVRGANLFSGAGMVPQGTSLPYQVCTEIDTDFHDHLEGSGAVFTTLVQLDHYGDNEANAQTMADRARAVLSSHKGIVTSGGNTITIKWIRITDARSLPVRPKSAEEVGAPRIRQEYTVAYVS